MKARRKIGKAASRAKRAVVRAARKAAPKKKKAAKPAGKRKLGAAIPLPVLRERLLGLYPVAYCELEHKNAFELLVATILSAQCTDERVNKTTPALFARFPTPEAMAGASTGEVEALVKSTGFFRNKTKSILGAARRIVTEYGGRVPDTMEEILTLPGVARKTASVVLGNAFGKNEGIAVDTHVMRLTQRWGITRETDPKKIEQELMQLLPREEWTSFSHRTIFHGRRVCDAKKPDCGRCTLADLCPSAA
jgi:endonuclease III